MNHVVVVGASLAGLRAAEALRNHGFEGDLTVVGDEPHPPYDRPPLSKEMLAGEWTAERAALPTTDVRAEWLLGRRAASLDVDAGAVELDGGEHLGFDGLVIATGAAPRTLPGTDGLAGVHTLRTLDDCLAIRAALDRTPSRVVVVGAGFIGAEVAATCRKRGLDVTLLEALPVPLGRVLGEEMGAVCEAVHRDHGVDVRVNTGVSGFEGDGRVERVRLADGSAVDADVVVVGVGVTPNTAWLEGSGLALDDGVVCDESMLAAPGVVAAGDVARWPNRLFGELMRVEHWDNAIAQGEHAGRRLLGEDEPFTPVPWFWSDQYEYKIQLAGRSAVHDEVRVVEGDVDERKFAALYRRGDRVVGVLGFNRPRTVMTYRRMIAASASWDEAMAAAQPR